jgi:hypothetical protein
VYADIADWCTHRVAMARNHLQIISSRRCLIEDVDVTDRVRVQIEDDIEQLQAIMAACRALHAASAPAGGGEDRPQT